MNDVINSSNVTQDHIDSGLNLMSVLWPSSVEVLLSELINLPLCFICLLILSKSKTFQSNAFILAKASFFNDMLAALYQFFYSSWHLNNWISKSPEIISINRCFQMISPQIFLIITTQALEMSIATDRLCCIKFPVRYHQMGKRFYRLIIAGCNFGGLISLIIAWLDEFPDEFILYCSLRVSLGDYAEIWFWLLLLAMNIITLGLYAYTVIFSKNKVKRIVVWFFNILLNRYMFQLSSKLSFDLALQHLKPKFKFIG